MQTFILEALFPIVGTRNTLSHKLHRNYVRIIDKFTRIVLLSNIANMRGRPCKHPPLRPESPRVSGKMVGLSE